MNRGVGGRSVNGGAGGQGATYRFGEKGARPLGAAGVVGFGCERHFFRCVSGGRRVNFKVPRGESAYARAQFLWINGPGGGDGYRSP